MAKSLSLACICVSLLASNAFAQKSLVDASIEQEATLELLQKQKQVQDMLQDDPVLKQLPRVVSVMVFGDQRSVRLQSASGTVLSFSPGDEIMPRMHVANVTPRRVSVAITPLSSARGKKPVNVALDFVPRALTNGAPGGGVSGALGTPGTPVGPIPAELRQAPPSMPISGAMPWRGEGSTASRAAAAPATPQAAAGVTSPATIPQ